MLQYCGIAVTMVKELSHRDSGVLPGAGIDVSRCADISTRGRGITAAAQAGAYHCSAA
jgi:hypothetical protein